MASLEEAPSATSGGGLQLLPHLPEHLGLLLCELVPEGPLPPEILREESSQQVQVQVQKERLSRFWQVILGYNSSTTRRT